MIKSNDNISILRIFELIQHGVANYIANNFLSLPASANVTFTEHLNPNRSFVKRINFNEIAFEKFPLAREVLHQFLSGTSNVILHGENDDFKYIDTPVVGILLMVAEEKQVSAPKRDLFGSGLMFIDDKTGRVTLKKWNDEFQSDFLCGEGTSSSSGHLLDLLNFEGEFIRGYVNEINNFERNIVSVPNTRDLSAFTNTILDMLFEEIRVTNPRGAGQPSKAKPLAHKLLLIFPDCNFPSWPKLIQDERFGRDVTQRTYSRAKKIAKESCQNSLN